MSTTTTSPCPADIDLGMTSQQLAEQLGITERTMRNWRSAGKGPRYFKAPGTQVIRYDPADVADWLDHNRRYTADDAPAGPADFQQIEETVARIVDDAPPLTHEQRERLAVVLKA